MGKHAVKNFVLGLIIGIFSVIMTYVQLNFVLKNSINIYLTIIFYGVLTMVAGVILELIFDQKHKK
jgi:hypothetical protein